jgi:hypothetical protein
VLVERSSWNAISGEVSLLFVARVCQNGVDSVAARSWKASPMRPETVPSIRPWSRFSTVRKVWEDTEKDPMVTVSVALNPWTLPLP